MRFLRHTIAGWAAAPPTAIAGGTVNDLFSDRERAAAMAFCVAMPLIGAHIYYLSILIMFTICDFLKFHRRCGYIMFPHIIRVYNLNM